MEETLEEAAERIFKKYSNNTSLAEGHYDYMMYKEDFKEASLEISKWQAERMYSKEEIKEAYWNRTDDIDVDGYWISDPEKDLEELLKEMKKIPMTFIPDERMYSEEEVLSMLRSFDSNFNQDELKESILKKWFEQVKKK